MDKRCVRMGLTRWRAKSDLFSPLWRGSTGHHPTLSRLTEGDLTNFRRFLGDVEIEAITADRIRKYLTRMTNRATR
jgi:hypothetical protein